MTDSGNQPTPEEIDQMMARLDEADYYELLQLSPREVDEDPSIVTEKFRQMASRWHADRLGGASLSKGDRKRARRIFSELNKAHRTLADAERRAEYDAKLEAGDIDIDAIFDSESAFRRGKTIMKTGDYSRAYAFFERAYELHPDEQQYRAHKLFTEYASLPKTEDGRPRDTERAEQIDDELAQMNEAFEQRAWFHFFRGAVAKGLGRTDEAQALFERAVELEPEHTDAKRQLRLIEMRRAGRRATDESDDSWWDRLRDTLNSLFGGHQRR